VSSVSHDTTTLAGRGSPSELYWVRVTSYCYSVLLRCFLVPGILYQNDTVDSQSDNIVTMLETAK